MAPGRPGRGSGDLPIDRDPSRIEAMFGGIAARYDLMNRIMTVGLDAALAPHGGLPGPPRPGG